MLHSKHIEEHWQTLQARCEKMLEIPALADRLPQHGRTHM